VNGCLKNLSNSRKKERKQEAKKHQEQVKPKLQKKARNQLQLVRKERRVELEVRILENLRLSSMR
jgi:transposase